MTLRNWYWSYQFEMWAVSGLLWMIYTVHISIFGVFLLIIKSLLVNFILVPVLLFFFLPEHNISLCLNSFHSGYRVNFGLGFSGRFKIGCCVNICL